MKKNNLAFTLTFLLSVKTVLSVAESDRFSPVILRLPNKLGLVAAFDSVGVEKKGGKRFILHRVNEGQTLFSIARQYKTSVDALKAANADLGGNVRYGQVVRVPAAYGITSRKESKAIDKAIRKEEKQKERAAKAEQPVKNEAKTARSKPKKSEDPAQAGIHVVETGQTVYSLAVRYGVSQADVRRWNGLNNDHVLIGQALIVSEKAHQARMPSPSNPAVVAKTDTHTKSVESTPDVPRPERSEPKNEPARPERNDAPVARAERPSADRPSVDRSTSERSTPKRTEETPAPTPAPPSTSDEGRNIPLPRPADVDVLLPRAGNDAPMPTKGRRISQNGVAELIEGADDSNKFLALHKTAPAGTLVQVRNEFNNQSLWVKVIGKLPDTGINDKILIKLSARAFEKLSPQDRRFRAEVSYLVP